MPPQTTATLKTIFSDVLANLAFMFTDDEIPEPPQGDPWIETTIDYKGPRSGQLRFLCTPDFCVLLAANLLGVDPLIEEATQQSQDAVKEFMNIICGQFVTAVHGATDVYNLTIPEVHELSETPDLESSDTSQRATFCVDGHIVQLSHVPRSGPGERTP